MDSFKGKIAVVTGGGTGMGRELCVQLVKEGCAVATCDVMMDNLTETKALCGAVAPDIEVTLHQCDVSSETEINRFRQFPKNRPDLYIRTPDGKEAIVVIADDKPPYIVRKRLDEIITHSEDESWEGNNYPHICFVLKDSSAKFSFLYTTNKKLEGMGMDEGELPILASALTAFDKPAAHIWSSLFNPKKQTALFD